MHSLSGPARVQGQAQGRWAFRPLGDRWSCLVYDAPSASHTSSGTYQSPCGWEGTMGEASWQALARRVDRLGRESRWWKRLASVTLVLLGITVLLGAEASKKAKSPAELRGHRIVLVDKAERGRAELTMMPDNQPGLMLQDDAGKPRLMLTLSKSGEPTLSFADASGMRRIVLNLDLYGTLLRFTDDAGNPRATLVVPSAGEPELELS